MGGAIASVNSMVQNATGIDITGQGAAAQGLQAQQAAAQGASSAQMDMFNQTQQNLRPYMDAGKGAVGQLSSQMGQFNKPFSMSDFQQDPGYQFMLQQGQQAVQRSSAVTGGLVSGSQLAALNNYSQNMAQNEYGNAFNRYQTQQGNSFNRLSSLAGLGQNAAAGVGTFGANAAQAVANNTMGAANAQAAYGQQQQQQTMSLLGMGAGIASASMGKPPTP